MKRFGYNFIKEPAKSKIFYDFFTEPVKKIVKPEDVARRGMTIEEVTKALNTYDVDAKLTYGTMINPCEFRNLLKKVFYFIIIIQ